jgi:hypothetical protein
MTKILIVCSEESITFDRTLVNIKPILWRPAIILPMAQQTQLSLIPLCGKKGEDHAKLE